MSILRTLSLSFYNVDKSDLIQRLKEITVATEPDGLVSDGSNSIGIFLENKLRQRFSFEQLMTTAIPVDSVHFINLRSGSSIKQIKRYDAVNKEDRQYIRIVSYDYIGNLENGTSFLEKNLKK
jgi:hypothetical protein